MSETNFSLFRERLALACALRNTTPHKLARSHGLGARWVIDFEYSGLEVLDIPRLCQIADRLDVSTDWLLGRTAVMELPEDDVAKG